MKIIFASDSFKGSLSSEETADILKKAAGEVFPHAKTEGIPVADGGEGTVDALISAAGGQRIYAEVHDPLGNKIKTYYGDIGGGKAVIEMAAASGLPLVPEELRDPRNTTTYGTGELIRDAAERGFDEIIIAIGGSATNDGGTGCMRALGVRFFDRENRELEGYGRDLADIRTIDTSGLMKELSGIRITVMCDVTSVLCGPEGATFTFARQKGATDEILKQLESGMLNYRECLIRKFGRDPDEIKGAGAAGGLGAALALFLDSDMRSGVETMLDLIDFDSRISGCSLVVTGEGRTDMQSCYGKVMQGVGNRCKKAGIPAVGLCGSLGEGAEKILDEGITSLFTTVSAPMQLDEAIERAGELYYDAAVRMFRFIRTGMEMRKDNE